MDKYCCDNRCFLEKMPGHKEGKVDGCPECNVTDRTKALEAEIEEMKAVMVLRESDIFWLKAELTSKRQYIASLERMVLRESDRAKGLQGIVEMMTKTMADAEAMRKYPVTIHSGEINTQLFKKDSK